MAAAAEEPAVLLVDVKAAKESADASAARFAALPESKSEIDHLEHDESHVSMKLLLPLLTPEEAAEIKAHPAPFAPRDAAHFLLRQSIAKKIHALIVSQVTRPGIRAIYEAYPLWQFYTNKSGMVRRCHGVIEMKKKPDRLHMTTLLHGVNNVPIDGVPCDAENAIPLTEWTADHKSMIAVFTAYQLEAGVDNELATSAAAFLDPVGFLCL